jgi:hypothetical protein
MAPYAILDGQRPHSASDHANFLACAHLTALDLLARLYPEPSAAGQTRGMTSI